jgi:hypothetical protein
MDSQNLVHQRSGWIGVDDPLQIDDEGVAAVRPA